MSKSPFTEEMYNLRVQSAAAIQSNEGLRFVITSSDQFRSDRGRKLGTILFKDLATLKGFVTPLQNAIDAIEAGDYRGRPVADLDMLNCYISPVSDVGDLMPVEEFRESVKTGLFTDEDGTGMAVKDGLMNAGMPILPSDLMAIPADATHVIWFNK